MIDAARDLLVQFSDDVQAAVSDTDYTMRGRTQECIALLPIGNIACCVARAHLKWDGARAKKEKN